ncbi:hypothetical protein V5N11_001956 [Cardamine amara subsp. amara]|uniref:NYN domain-containing protein n=1 Tax=Cardamine amara subsp. amara TaxID=228776 RepID=A0ABD1A5J9_CARAN
MMKKATQEEGVAVTWVFWDMNMCPVPTDPSVVRGCILKKNGYCGPLNVTAFGKLGDVPTNILRKVYSSGITLHNVPYGPSDTANLISEWSHQCNIIMVISNAKIFAYQSDFLKSRFNLIEPFPNDSLESFCLADLGELEEDECSETGESAFWICSVCNYHNTPIKGFENFTAHLSSTSHQHNLSELLPISYELGSLSSPLSEPPEINLEAVTWVFWDINMCPVPPGCDPRRVGPCIKRFLEKKGYSGPLTITAIGVLTNVPFDILGGVYPSGIALNNVYETGLSASSDLIYDFTDSNPPPANILVISDAKNFDSDYAFELQSEGYNLLQPFPCDSLESFFLADSGALEKGKCSESALWICSVCSHDNQGFKNFTTHVTSRRHEQELLDWLPGNARFLSRENIP